MRGTRLIRRHKAIVLALIVLLGLGLRLQGLGRVGFNEDEINKLEAAESYLRGDFSVNLEHPMLMKSMVTISIAASHWWNCHSGRTHVIPDEVAVRLPNVIFGSLTSVVLFLIAQEFFGFEVGLLSALLWASGILAITINRIAKEDTLLVFFTWLAYYCYVHAKRVAATDARLAEKYYVASGASFGLMLASKYFPHYLGLIFLFYYLFGDKKKYPPRRHWDTLLFFGALGLVFLLADPVILLPSTWRYLLHYTEGQEMTHHGYLMMGHFYSEDFFPGFGPGMPIYFYPLFLILKTPLPLLAAFAAGLATVFRRRHEPGASFLIFMFLSWIVPFSLLRPKWLRWMLAWMPAVCIITAHGLVKMISWSSSLGKRRRLSPALAAVAVLVFLATPVWISAKSAPFYSLYLNPLGRGRTGYYFPHDEMNDMGLRVAIKQICEEAPRNATVGGESKPVFIYYSRKFGRDDLHYFDFAGQIKSLQAFPSPYFVIHNGREYFENISFIRELESKETPVQVIELGGADAAEIYHAEELARVEASP